MTHDSVASQKPFAAIGAHTLMLVSRLLSRKQSTFSDTFFHKHRQHVIRVLRKAGIYFSVSALIAFLFVLAYWSGRASIIEAAIAIAVFGWLLFGICYGVPQSLRARVVPYFEKQLNGIDTFEAGSALLAHSRQLDELAGTLGAKPLSQSSSGDDLIPNEQLVWFDPAPALETTQKLLQCDEIKNFPPEVTDDLTRLGEALRIAVNRDVRFCLLLREGVGISGLEMEKRRGDFF